MPHGSGAFIDPYVYPDTDLLRNIPGKRTRKDLELAEYLSTYARRVELEEEPIKGPFDFHRLKETHRRLFQDIYEWAGLPRTVEISKGSSQFHQSAYIDTAAWQTFGWLADSGLLAPDVDDDRFIELTAELLEKINYIHPFREGNGRAQRAFLDQVAAVSGRKLSWRNISKEDHLRASINAFRDGHGEAFRSVVRQAMRPPIDGLSQLDPQTYGVSEPVVTRPGASASSDTIAERRRRFPELFGNHESSEQPGSPERER